MHRLKVVGVALWVAAGGIAAGCGGDGGASQLSAGTEGHLTACPKDLPDSCVEPVPSYKNDVAPLLERYCYSCHSDGGAAPDHVFDTYQLVKARGKNDAFVQVDTCRMPPVILPQPTSAERQIILDWFVCDAPNN